LKPVFFRPPCGFEPQTLNIELDPQLGAFVTWWFSLLDSGSCFRLLLANHGSISLIIAFE
jgi:hypothetical protein